MFTHHQAVQLEEPSVRILRNQEATGQLPAAAKNGNLGLSKMPGLPTHKNGDLTQKIGINHENMVE